MGNIIAPLLLLGIAGTAGYFFYRYYIRTPPTPSNPDDPNKGSPTLDPEVPYNGGSTCNGGGFADIANPACRQTPVNPLSFFDQFAETNPIIKSTLEALRQAAERNTNTHSNVAQINGGIFLQ